LRDDVDVRLSSRDALDLSDRDSVERYVTRLTPTTIVNCAAYTAVDRAEEKPRSNWAVTGIYFSDSQVVYIARDLKASARGTLEITEVIRVYLERYQLAIEIMA